MAKKNWKKKEEHLDFKVTKSLPIEELKLQLIELVHKPTGAQVLHLQNDDPENLFCISFKTLPNSSNGVAHILEHTVLCGSKKYPVKDPFFSMTRRSLNTFMNALTGADFTCYPAATQVPKDFYNLFDVYLDAVFHPEIGSLSFLQEGIRVELKDPKDLKSPLEFKGIVFNEMKGALASPSSRLHEEVMKNLFDKITYGINSGGDPSVIPELTHAKLKAFHKKYYHPSRALFFFYGNMPLEGHLKYLKEKILDESKKVPKLPHIKKQPRFKSPKRVKTSFPFAKEENEEKQTYISFAWLTETIEEQEKLLAIGLLLLMIMDHDASPLKMALLKSGLATQAAISMDSDMTEAPVILTLQGCDAKDLAKIRKLVFDSMKEIAKNGIDKELVENAFHQFEFHRSEITGDHYPFGLTLFMRCALVKQHGVSPESALTIHTMIERLKKADKKNPRFFEELLEKYFIHNTHHVEVCMSPDKNLSEKEQKAEEKKLKTLKEKLSSKKIHEIIKNSQKLKTLQESEENNIDCLPKLTLKDVPKKMRDYELKKTASLFYHPCFTNHIVYTDVVFNLPDLEEKELFPLRLFSYLLPQLGFKGKDYQTTLKEIQANTGGMAVNLCLNTQANDFQKINPTLHLSGKSLYRKAPRFFDLLLAMIESPDFEDRERIEEILAKHWTSVKSRFNSQALKYAINSAASSLSLPSKIQNSWHGFDYYWKLRDLVENEDGKKLTELIGLMKSLKNKIFTGKPDLVVSGDETFIKSLRKEPLFHLEIPPEKEKKKASFKLKLPAKEYSAYTLASPVSFIARVIQTVPYDHLDAPLLALGSSLFDNTVLHQKVREEGGAYGGGSAAYSLSGQFAFYSYRDPHIAHTLQAFEDAVIHIKKGNFSSRELEEAKLENIQNLDSPVSPGNRSDLAYAFLREGRTFDIRKKYREDLLKASKKEVVRAIEKYIAPYLDEASTVVFAGRELIEKENKNLKKPLKVKSI